jgi:hypothetical protein
MRKQIVEYTSPLDALVANILKAKLQTMKILSNGQAITNII